MNEPRDDLGDARPDLARELIGAGRAERASGAARLLAADALLTAGASAAGAAQSGAWLTMLKWLSISVFVLGSGAAAWRARHGEVKPPLMALTNAPRPLPPRSGVPSVAAPSDIAERAAVSETGSRAASPHAVVTASARAPLAADLAAPAGPSSAAERDERLRRELDSLRTAREALAQGLPLRALALLHAQPDGFTLLPVEAGIVRIEALRSAGSEHSARRLAADLLRDHGSGPYAERLKGLTQAPIRE